MSEEKLMVDCHLTFIQKDIAEALSIVANQEHCDDEEFVLMRIASDYIKELRGKLDAQSAYIEELRTALETIANADTANPFLLAKRALSNQYPTTSLEQVKKEARLEVLTDLAASIAAGATYKEACDLLNGAIEVAEKMGGCQ